MVSRQRALLYDPMVRRLAVGPLGSRCCCPPYSPPPRRAILGEQAQALFRLGPIELVGYDSRIEKGSAFVGVGDQVLSPLRSPWWVRAPAGPVRLEFALRPLSPGTSVSETGTLVLVTNACIATIETDGQRRPVRDCGRPDGLPPWPVPTGFRLPASARRVELRLVHRDRWLALDLFDLPYRIEPPRRIGQTDVPWGWLAVYDLASPSAMELGTER